MNHAQDEKRLVIHATVRDLADGGEGIAVLSCPEESKLDGRVAFIPGAVPGDVLEVLNLQDSKPLRVKSYLITKPSSTRQQPPCPIFPECGGCTLQDIRYEETLLWKQKRVKDVVSRIAKIEHADTLVQPCLGMEKPERFRGRVRLQHAFQDGVSGLGFYEAGSNQVTETEDCLIQTMRCNQVRPILKEMIQKLPQEEAVKLTEVTLRENRKGDSFLILFHCADTCDPEIWKQQVLSIQEKLPENASSWLQAGESTELHYLCGPETFTEHYGNIRIEYSPLAFSQTNLVMDEVLYQEVIESIQTNILAAEMEHASILELYCGSGSLTLKLAEAFPQARIQAVEIFSAAIEDARHNAELNRDKLGLLPEFICADVAVSLGEESHADILVLDPPRQGIGKGVSAKILELAPSHIVYVSCDPATLARDIADLKEHYEIKRIQPVDMFPWTTHVETVVLMSRVKD